MPRFSVIIPLYNKSNYIAEALKSVCSQTFDDFELIIVNDCSTDNSLEIAKKNNDSRITIIEHPQNKGLSASRNTGIQNMNSLYAVFLDADDSWKLTFLEKIDYLIETYPQAALFATNYETLLSEKKKITFTFNITNDKKHDIVENFFKSNLNYTTYIPSGLCVKKDVFDKIGNYNESISYSEDVDFNIRANANFKMAYYNEPLVMYTFDSENQITQKSIKGKVVPDFDYYEKMFPERADIKKYLDFHRYIKAKLFKLSKDTDGYAKMIRNLDFKNLTKTQRILLKSPRIVLLLVKKLKYAFLKLGIDLNSY